MKIKGLKNLVFVYPTETQYGLGCDARDAQAVKKIYTIKGRSGVKALIVLAADRAMARRLIDPVILKNKEVVRVMRTFWPGALTLVLPASAWARHNLAAGIIARNGTIAVRVSPHPVASGIAKNFGAPIVSTSANLSGQPTSNSPPGIKRAFARAAIKPDLFIDGGVLPKSKPSTIAIWQRGKWKIARPGAVVF